MDVYDRQEQMLLPSQFFTPILELDQLLTMPGTLHIRDLKHLYENNSMFSFQF